MKQSNWISFTNFRFYALLSFKQDGFHIYLPPHPTHGCGVQSWESDKLLSELWIKRIKGQAIFCNARVTPQEKRNTCLAAGFLHVLWKPWPKNDKARLQITLEGSIDVVQRENWNVKGMKTFLTFTNWKQARLVAVSKYQSCQDILFAYDVVNDISVKIM